MIGGDRINGILNYLREHKSATVEELASVFFASAATIRRDLKEMHRMGLIERSRGGAFYYESSEEVSIFVRVAKNAKEKELTATIALNHLPDFQSVFIDNSSTCLALAERMNLANKTVITNGLQIASRLSRQENVSIIMPGGEVHYNTNSMTGSMTCEALRRFTVDLMLSSCAALTGGCTYEYSLDTMQLKRTAFERSRMRYLLADSSKLNMTAVYCTKEIFEYDAIFTNASDEQIRPLLTAGVKIINR